MRYLVGIDVGTTSCKTCVFDLKGKLLGSANEDYPGYYEHPGWAELKEEDMVPKIFSTCRSAIENAGIKSENIVGVAIGTIAGATILTDESNQALYNFLSWQDTRVIETDILERFFEKITPEEFYEITGHPPMPFAVLPCKYIWMKQNALRVFDKMKHVCTFQDYINKKIGANGYYTDASTAGRHCMCNTKGQTGWSPKIVHEVGLSIEQLPIIVEEAGKVIGHIDSSISEQTGLPIGCPICLGAHDQECCNLGSGGNATSVGVMTLGTLGTFSITSDQPIRATDISLISNAKQGQRKFTIECVGESSASSFKWYKEVICSSEEIGENRNEIPFDAITKVVNTVPIGANKVSFIPSLSQSEGAFLGISLGTNKKELARAVMEGIAFEMLENFESVTRVGVECDVIRLAGGVAKSEVWCQMLADIFQKEIHINQCHEVGCLGAAIYAGVGTKVFESIDEGVEKMVHFRKVFKPIDKHSEKYQSVYQTWLARKKKIIV